MIYNAKGKNSSILQTEIYEKSAFLFHNKCTKLITLWRMSGNFVLFKMKINWMKSNYIADDIVGICHFVANRMLCWKWFNRNFILWFYSSCTWLEFRRFFFDTNTMHYYAGIGRMNLLEIQLHKIHVIW